MSDSAVHDSCQARLQALTHHWPSVVFACLSTVDGRGFAFVGQDSAPLQPRVSAISSSLLALSESFVKEALRSRCNYTTLSTEHGSIITVRVPSLSRRYVLSVGMDAGTILAMALRLTLDAADDIAAFIDRADEH